MKQPKRIMETTASADPGSSSFVDRLAARLHVSPEFLKFLLVGGVTFVLNLAAFKLLYDVLPVLPASDTAFELMDKFLGLRLRHLLIDRAGDFIGLLSIGDVVRCALGERTRELEELQVVANWEYYEEWKPRQ